MNKELTEIVLVVDRSGSMCTCVTDAQGGINTFIEEQKKEDGKANLTLVQFDNEYEFIHEGVDIQDVKEYELIPRGMTGLYDALGRAINETGERLAKMDESERPGLVVVVVVTDGQENASTEFKCEQVREMIKHQEEKYNWEFVFLGAGVDAFQDGVNLGFKSSATVNYSVDNIAQAYVSSSANVSRMRYATKSCQAIDNSFTDAEIASMQ